VQEPPQAFGFLSRERVLDLDAAPQAYDLEGFVAIAEHGQLGRAAAALHLTQPSLTARLQRLEAELGTSLSQRTRRGMLLTSRASCCCPMRDVRSRRSPMGAAPSRAAIARPVGSRSPPRRP
jgi:hypothetical protein